MCPRPPRLACVCDSRYQGQHATTQYFLSDRTNLFRKTQRATIFWFFGNIRSKFLACIPSMHLTTHLTFPPKPSLSTNHQSWRALIFKFDLEHGKAKVLGGFFLVRNSFRISCILYIICAFSPIFTDLIISLPGEVSCVCTCFPPSFVMLQAQDGNVTGGIDTGIACG